MGYPKKYVGHYAFLAEWLSQNGFRVYPMEMFCKPVPVVKPLPEDRAEWRRKHGYSEYETHYLYGNVDVVAWKNRKLWAFEVKHQGDPCKRALAQAQKLYPMLRLCLCRSHKSQRPYKASKCIQRIRRWNLSLVPE